MAKPNSIEPAIPVPFKTLISLFGKRPKDPEVLAVMGTAGKVSFQSDFILAKQAGFDFSVDRPEHAEGNEPQVLSTLFLFGAGTDGHRGYADLPRGFTFAPTRDALLASLPEPRQSWVIGKGKVPPLTPGVAHDTWMINGVEVSAIYSSAGGVHHYNVSLPEDMTGGQDLSADPLHFETKPVDAPRDANLVGMALLVAWAAERFGLPAKHANSALGKQLVARKITPRAFLTTACGGRLSSLDFVPKLADFLYEYRHQVIDDEGVRKKADAAIAKLLHLEDRVRRVYTDDFVGTFKHAVESPFYVPDSWQAVDRIAPVLDARLADFESTRFLKAPALVLYEKAAKLRDKHKVAPHRATLAKPAPDNALAEELVALIGKSLKDKQVQAVLTRAGMPIGKRIDEQANPVLGLSYLGAKFEIGGKRELGVDSVNFYAAKQKSYIRGIGAEVQIGGYPGALPKKLAFGESRAEVRAKLGKASDSDEDTDSWMVGKPKLRMNCRFARGKLVELSFGQPRDW